MTVTSEVQRIKKNITDTYAALNKKGAVIPRKLNSGNLASTVKSVFAASDYILKVTAENRSSVDRAVGEKVWVSKSSGAAAEDSPYYLTDYSDSDISTVTGACNENIAKGAKGSVSLLAKGELVKHVIKNFTEYNVSSADALSVDAEAKIASINATSNGYICSPQRVMTDEELRSLRFTVRFKIINNSSEEVNTAECSYDLCGCLDRNRGSQCTLILRVLRSSVVLYVPCGDSQTELRAPLKFATGFIKLDTWYSVMVSINGNHEIVYIKNEADGTDAKNEMDAESIGFNASCAANYFYIGNRVHFSGEAEKIRIVYDLSKSCFGSYDTENIYWQPDIKKEA